MSTQSTNAPQQRKHTYSESLTFRLPADDRIELYRLASRRRQPVSEVLRDLIAQATTKKTPVRGAQSNNAPAA